VSLWRDSPRSIYVHFCSAFVVYPRCSRVLVSTELWALVLSVSFSQRTLLGGPFVTETFRPPNILCWRSPGETALASNSIDAQCSSPTLYRFCV
jgi:hypothetical protein